MAALCGWPLAGAAFEVSQGDVFGGFYDLHAYVRLEEDVLLFKDVTEPVSTRDAELRRARLGLNLLWDDDWLLRVAGNLARHASLRDLSVEYRGWSTRIELGRFPEPFSLGESINSTDRLVITRPSPTALGPDYGFGAGFNRRGRNWSLAGGIFTRAAGRELSGRFPEDAVSARATWRPLAGEEGYLHLGLSTSLRRTPPGSGVQLGGTGESPLASGLAPQSYLQTGADRYRLLGAEAAARVGPVLVLAEAIRAHVMNAGPAWHGEYLEAGWCLTGEQRSYSTRYGTVGGISPDRPVGTGGYGAWELAARISRTDLSDGGGDRGRVTAMALNWYPVDLVRISLGAQHAYRDLADGSRRSGHLGELQLQIGL